jgi:two-component system phosphate regulon sensor histidine kinase PhoR
MKFQLKYFYLAIFYLLAIIYVVISNNPFINVILLIGLFLLSLYFIIDIQQTIIQDKEKSLSSLEYRLTKTKKQNEETYKKFISLSRTLGSGVFMVDADGIITFSNKDIEDYFGMDLNNKEYTQLKENSSLYQFVYKAFLMEEKIKEQINIDEKTYELISTPIKEHSMFIGCLILVHDITTIKTAQNIQKRFTADVSHELKTPLSSIKGLSEIMLRDEHMTKEHRQEFIQLIYNEAIRMELIVRDLMIISKLDRLDYELELQQEDIVHVVSETLRPFQSKLEEKGLTLKVEVEPCELMYDKLRMSQLISNLIRNAMNYTDKGSITIMGYKNNQEYILKVADTGIGIEEKYLQRIFTRFYRIDKARSRDTGGSGLGLSICKHVILKHGGTIEVESKINVGTTFVVTLPIRKV